MDTTPANSLLASGNTNEDQKHFHHHNRQHHCQGPYTNQKPPNPWTCDGTSSNADLPKTNSTTNGNKVQTTVQTTTANTILDHIIKKSNTNTFKTSYLQTHNSAKIHHRSLQAFTPFSFFLIITQLDTRIGLNTTSFLCKGVLEHSPIR